MGATATTIDKSVAINEVRKWLEFVMKRKGWNGTELARAAGVAPSTILRMFSAENYTFLTSLTTIGAVASASGFKPPESLMAAYGVAATGFESDVSPPRRMPSRYAPAADGAVAESDHETNLAQLPLGRVSRRAAEPEVTKTLVMRNVSPFPKQFVFPTDGAMSVPCPERLVNDPTAFAFRFRETTFEPAIPHGALMYATKARNVVTGDMLLITKSDGSSVVRILHDQNEQGIVVYEGFKTDATKTIPVDKIDEVSIVVIVERN